MLMSKMVTLAPKPAATLAALVRDKPADLAALSRVSGIGEAKLKVTSIRLQDDNAVIAYEILEE